MVIAGRFVVALALAGLFSSPLYADVIPSRRAETTDSAQKVQGRLVELGFSKDAAASRVDQLTDRETNYFAQNPDRVQIVGQEAFGGQTDLFWWEWVFGILALGAVAFWAVNFK